MVLKAKFILEMGTRRASHPAWSESVAVCHEKLTPLQQSQVDTVGLWKFKVKR